MKVFPNILTGIEECLYQIFFSGKYSGDVLEKAFRNNKKWGSRDRKFIAEAVFEIVRWQRLLAYAADTDTSEPDYLKKLIVVYLLQSGLEAPASFMPPTDPFIIFNKLSETNIPPAIKFSVPDWLSSEGESRLGEKWYREIEALNSKANVYLRTNTLKVTAQQLKQRLERQNIETEFHPDVADCLILVRRQNLSGTREYEEGLFEVQDAGSQQIVPFLQVSPGQLTVDACAGGGGKTLQIAALSGGKGKIIALDVEENKLRNLRERAVRAGVNYITTQMVSQEVIRKLYNQADRLLLDVPCTGLGVLKRNPDTKWKLNPAELERILQLQEKILKEYTTMLKPGGIMVYATCSILPQENEKQIQNFLISSEESFLLEEERHIWPSEGADGFYMARVRKLL